MLRLVLLTACLASVAHTSQAQSIVGTATYRERMALPAGSVFEATLEDVSRADAPSAVIASTRVTSPGNPPIAFIIAYDPTRIVARAKYVLRAKILLDGRLLFTSDTATPVIPQGGSTQVSLMLTRVSSAEPPASALPPSPQTPATGVPLERTYWRAVELAGAPTPVRAASHEAHLVFEAGNRVTGADGCNRVMGGYDLKANDGIAFRQLAGTQMACIDAAGTEQPYRDALGDATRWRITGNRLELFGATGSRVAAFEARPPSATAPSPGATPTPTPIPGADLRGTVWQLVRFQGTDERVLTPDDRSKYTLEFGADGTVAAQVDCNRGRAVWKSSTASQLELGPLALTRAECPPGSLHDHIVKQWPYIRSYVLRGGHLFLSLMADGGIYEFEPVRRP